MKSFYALLIFVFLGLLSILLISRIKVSDSLDKDEKKRFVSSLNYSFSCNPVEVVFLNQQYGKAIIKCQNVEGFNFNQNIESELQSSLEQHEFLHFIVSQENNEISFLMSGLTNGVGDLIDSIFVDSEKNTVSIFSKKNLLMESSLTNNLYWEVYDLNDTQ